MRARRYFNAVALVIALIVLQAAHADTGLPVAGPPIRGAAGDIVALTAIPPVTSRVIDGNIDDWLGSSTRFGGTAIYSAGELIYQDHIFDAYGADDGRDSDRTSTHDPIIETAPETYRVEPALQYVPDELGVEMPHELQAFMNYGNLPFQSEADLQELRLASDGASLFVLARMTTMLSSDRSALILLIDSAAGSDSRQIPFNSHLTSERADFAVLLNGNSGRIVNLSDGSEAALQSGAVASNPAGYTNSVEARIPVEAIGSVGDFSVAAATGVAAGGALSDVVAGQSVANVAFRLDEPVRGDWFEKLQAFALFEGNIDRFFHPASITQMVTGATERYRPRSGYHDRIFVSTETISREQGEEGIYQHYGIYFPTSYDESVQTPLQFWLHWRGGKGHTAAAVTPRIFQHFGEDQNTIVVSPKARGTSRWYVGKGHVDFLEVWDDVMSSFSIDANQVYVTGHSMGGWGSFLLTILYPDRFAAAAPVSPPVTQGAWTGVDFPGCDSFRAGEYTPCYLDANGGNARVQHTRRLLENVRHVPWAILTGNADELVPYAGVARQAQRLVELGYTHRLYSFPTYEHYSIPIVDEWAEAAKYEHLFTRDPNPSRVSYIRDMPFERTVELSQADQVPLNFDFDHAYWMSELTPLDLQSGVARFEGHSLAIIEAPLLTLPDAGGPTAVGQAGPFVMTGLRKIFDVTKLIPTPVNGFEVSVSGASAVRLDLGRMQINSQHRVTGLTSSDVPFELRLSGSWSSLPTVTINGSPAAASLSGGVLRISVPSGESAISIG